MASNEPHEAYHYVPRGNMVRHPYLLSLFFIIIKILPNCLLKLFLFYFFHVLLYFCIGTLLGRIGFHHICVYLVITRMNEIS